MDALTLLESNNKNHYFYDQQVNSTQWCHPILYYILQLHRKGVDLNHWYGELNYGDIHLEGIGTFSEQEIDYYFKKFRLLLENGYFTQSNPQPLLDQRLSARQVESSLVNTRQVTFEMVDYCNLDCAYCTYGKFYDNYDHREHNKMDSATAITFLNYLVRAMNSPLNESHDRPITIGFYGGEPLLNMPFIKDVVKHIRQLQATHNRFIFNITTNALLLEKHMDFLVEHDFSLLISLDGDETGNSYRTFHDQTPAFNQIVKNVDALKSKYPDYFRTRVNFNSVFHNRNSVTRIYRFFKNRYDKVPSISQLNPGGVSAEMRKEFWDTYANMASDLSRVEDYALVEKDMFHQLPDTREISSFLDQCSGFVFNDYNGLLSAAQQSQHNVKERIPTGTCFPFARKVFITVKGKILPCEHIGHHFALGQVTPENIRLDFKKIADKYNKYLDKVTKQCAKCANWNSCQQCLFYIDLQSPSPKCVGLCNNEKLSQRLSVNLSYLEENPRKYVKIMKEVRIE